MIAALPEPSELDVLDAEGCMSTAYVRAPAPCAAAALGVVTSTAALCTSGHCR
jgi:hypothetical protein